MQSLIAMAGAVALLVWGLYMVKTGILRTFGESLRSWLSTRLKNRLSGFAAGFSLAALLQSSTASALLIAGLQNKGLVSTAIALSCVLGADLGSAVVVKVLTLDLSALIPFLTIAGVIPFIRRPESRLGQFGRVLLGLAFVMTALRLIVSATEPLRASTWLQNAFAVICSHEPLCLLLGITLAMACFSSLAVVALASSATATGLLTGEAAVWTVLGANFGSALLAVLSTMGSSAVARRAPLGNFIFRGFGFALGALILKCLPEAVNKFSAASSDIIAFHLVFNAAIGLLGLLFVRPAARLVERLLPSDVVFPNTEVKLLLPENLLTSATSLSLASQEIAKTASFLQTYWPKLAMLLKTNPPAGILLSFYDDIHMLQRRCRAVERFLDVLLRVGLTPSEARRWQSLNAANDGLSYAADTYEVIVSALEEKKCQQNCFFTPEGLQELLDQINAIGLELADIAAVLSRQDAHGERKRALLSAIKLRENEAFKLVAQHMKRVAEGRSGAIETSTLHVDLISLFRRFEADVASIASNWDESA